VGFATGEKKSTRRDTLELNTNKKYERKKEREREGARQYGEHPDGWLLSCRRRCRRSENSPVRQPPPSTFLLLLLLPGECLRAMLHASPPSLLVAFTAKDSPTPRPAPEPLPLLASLRRLRLASEAASLGGDGPMPLVRLWGS
jgi:hypothetical protein